MMHKEPYPSITPVSTKRETHTWIVVGLTALAFALRFYRLGTQSLWLDEVLNVNDAMVPFSKIHRVILASPPLFHYIVRTFILVFGKDDFWLRTPSALFGVAAIPTFYFVARQFSSESVALWGALLLTISPFHMVYSQELRMYSLLALEALIALYFGERALQTEANRYWIGFILSSIMGLYTHNWFAFLTICQAVGYAVECRRNKREGRRGWKAFVIIGLLYLPWVPFLFKQTDRSAFWPVPNFSDFLTTLYTFSGLQVLVGDSGISFGRIAAPFLLMPAMICVLLGFFLPSSDRDRIRRLFCVGCAGPLTMAFIISKMGMPVYLAGRYTLLGLPAFLLLVGRGLGAPAPKIIPKIRLGLGILLVMCGTVLCGFSYVSLQKAPWKDMANWIIPRIRPGDAVMLGQLKYKWICMDYYLPPEIPRVRDYASDRIHERLFIPLYDVHVDTHFSDFGPKIRRQWEPDSLGTFSQGTVLVIRRKHAIVS